MSEPVSIPRSVWGILRTAVARAREERAPEAAAGIGFFAVFSFPPLLLIIVAVGSALLSDQQTQEQMLALILRFAPAWQELARRNLSVVFEARGAVGALGAAGLVWAASGAFTALVRNLSRAWPDAAVRGAVGARLMALVLVGALVAAAALFVGGRTAAALARNWGWLSGAFGAFASVFRFTWRAAIVAVMLMGLTVLYKWVPAVWVRWSEALFGATVAAVGFVAVTAGFTWYIESRFAAYNIVYGSLGAAVAFLAWVYMVALIALLGGHAAAAAAAWRRPQSKEGRANEGSGSTA